MNWDKIRQNNPNAFLEYMKSKKNINDFWEAYGFYVDLRVIEENTDCEYWEFKLESKTLMYKTLSTKTIKRNGKTITIKSRSKITYEKINEVFALIEKQIKGNNFLNN